MSAAVDLSGLAPKKTVTEAIESLAAVCEAIITTLPPEIFVNVVPELRGELLDFMHWRQNGSGVKDGLDGIEFVAMSEFRAREDAAE